METLACVVSCFFSCPNYQTYKIKLLKSYSKCLRCLAQPLVSLPVRLYRTGIAPNHLAVFQTLPITTQPQIHLFVLLMRLDLVRIGRVEILFVFWIHPIVMVLFKILRIKHFWSIRVWTRLSVLRSRICELVRGAVVVILNRL
jgi:hypothetical protein